MKYILFMFMIPSLTLMAFAAPDFDKAEKDIKFLKPNEVKELPLSVKNVLESENCEIPVMPGAQKPTSWAKGSFAEIGQTDWAVLCSNSSSKSQVRIIWGGKSKPCPESFGFADNKTYLQVQDENTIMFSRMIGSVGPKRVVSLLKKSKGPLPSSFSQDAIVDSFVGKGSTAHFCTAGNWQEVIASD
ncbi:MAG: hypothetical protein AABY64_13165 [Bdellovibrionota bacterium]